MTTASLDGRNATGGEAGWMSSGGRVVPAPRRVSRDCLQPGEVIIAAFRQHRHPPAGGMAAKPGGGRPS
jgi:hypothetical protein